jgi:Cd2+/Zn2+-exporting ATPase
VLRDVSIAIYRGLIFLVVSCPCAFAISVPLSYFSGIGRCGKQGILIKGSSFIDSCATTTKIVFDKTGTLTSGKFSVIKVESNKGIDKNELLECVVAGEKNSLHPLAVAVCEYYGKKTKKKVKDFVEIAGTGIEYYIDKDKYFVGKNNSRTGNTIVVVKKNDKLIGKIHLQDEIKPEAKEAISSIKELGIKTLCLSGDNVGIAKSVADTLELDDFKAGLLPEDKYKIIEAEKVGGERVAFVGDGLNDAPALTLSDTGISMGIVGSPATIETSDIVIADDDISKVNDLIKISKRTK